jgi:CSLREA domain-containing protein
MPLRLALPTALLLLPLGLSVPAAAAVFFANISNDVADAVPGDGICDVDLDTLGNQCSLRAAIQTANEDPGFDQVDLGAATYVLSIQDAGDDSAASGDLDVTSAVEVSSDLIVGSNTTTFIDSKKAKDRVFDVRPGGNLSVARVTLQNGRTPKGDFDPGFPDDVSGGCLRSAGTLQLNGVFFFRCRSSDEGGAIGLIGGSASLISTTFSNCRAKNEGGGLKIFETASATLSRVTAGACRAATGGAIATRSATTTVRNATLDGNKAKVGGGLALLGAGAATINSSTISSNQKVNLDASGTSGTVTVSNSILWGAKETDCLGTLVSAGGNLEGATSCGFTNVGSNDQQNQDPLLLPLKNYLGPVLTRQLSVGSPAIDHGLDAGAPCETNDARVRSRVDEAGVGVPGVLCDAGSFEFNGMF